MEMLLKPARYLYAIGMACLGIQQFMYAGFRPVILPPWPAFMQVPVLAYLVGAALIFAGALIIIEKKGRTVSLLLGAFLMLLFLVFQCPYTLFIQPNSAWHLGLWTDPLKELALSGGAFVMAGTFPGTSAGGGKKAELISLLEKCIPAGRIFFSITMFEFGLAHFYYPDFVATLVPAWIPGHLFWTYFAGVALMGSGIAIIFKIVLKPVALLLAAMLFLWVILLHIPRAIADPYGANGNEVTSVFEAVAFCGIALGIALTYKNRNQPV